MAQELATRWGREGKRGAVPPWPGQCLGLSPAQGERSAEADCGPDCRVDYEPEGWRDPKQPPCCRTQRWALNPHLAPSVRGSQEDQPSPGARGRRALIPSGPLPPPPRHRLSPRAAPTSSLCLLHSGAQDVVRELRSLSASGRRSWWPHPVFSTTDSSIHQLL